MGKQLKYGEGQWKDGLNCETCKYKEKGHSSMPCIICGRRKFDYYAPESD